MSIHYSIPATLSLTESTYAFFHALREYAQTFD